MKYHAGGHGAAWTVEPQSAAATAGRRGARSIFPASSVAKTAASASPGHTTSAGNPSAATQWKCPAVSARQRGNQPPSRRHHPGATRRPAQFPTSASLCSADNVFPAALLSAAGANRRVLRACLSRQAQPLMSAALFSEYEDLLARSGLMAKNLLTAAERQQLFEWFFSVLSANRCASTASGVLTCPTKPTTTPSNSPSPRTPS